MEKSFDTFEEELGTPGRPRQRPVRQVHRPDMCAQETRRTIPESTMPSQQEPPVMPVPQKMPSEFIRPANSTQPLQNLSQVETPWQGVTLNRCLLIAMTLLVISSGFQKLHETLKGRHAVEEEECYDALTVRRFTLRQTVQPQEPENSLYEVLFWWIPDLDDDDDEDDDDEDDDDEDDEDVDGGDKKIQKIQFQKRVREGSLKALRHRATPEGLLKGRKAEKNQRAKSGRNEKIIWKKKGRGQAELDKDKKH
ncbi:hypothetical protein DPEC_G00060340 [Dallia pectoralis]|uniref:Uncharacterized protein n=1 Tax=Dallia pectoralis TaxID=75939 RepID=A0ACC2H6L6_DALPE|nr:hypothetical protein DPEC_G00060340 [Dallia pectoralis]